MPIASIRQPAGEQVELYYRVHSSVPALDKDHADDEAPYRSSSAAKILLICGLSAQGDTEFFSQLVTHFVSLRDFKGKPVEFCTFDNRGVGRSTTPADPKMYSTDVMAQDTLALLQEHLCWQKAHIIGVSLGGMIASKVAALAPHAVSSLNIISSTASGLHMAKSLTLFSPLLTLQALPVAPLWSKVRANLRFNFSPAFLRATLPGIGSTRGQVMIRNTLEALKDPSYAKPGLSKQGQQGQLYAVARHRLSLEEVEVIQAQAIPVLLISGRHDPIAGVRYVAAMAKLLQCPHLITEAAHAGVMIESFAEVTSALEKAILGRQCTSPEELAGMALTAQANALEKRMTYELVTAFAPGRVAE